MLHITTYHRIYRKVYDMLCHIMACMASAQGSDDMFDQFLADRGHDVETADASWDESYNKKQCPDCGGLHDPSATACAVCGWSP